MVVGGVAMVLRELDPSDRAFIATTWGKSYRERSGVEPHIFEREHRKVIDRLLDVGRWAILASAEVPRTIYAWACAREDVLHYAYVVPELHGRGMMRLLLGHLGLWRDTIECSHRFSKPNTRFVWNPYSIGVCS
jgi:hypothetical protein